MLTGNKLTKKKMLANAEAWLKKAEFEKDILKGSIEAQFINEDGSIEKWGGLNKDEVIDKIERGFEKFKTEYIGKLKGLKSPFIQDRSGLTIFLASIPLAISTASLRSIACTGGTTYLKSGV